MNLTEEQRRRMEENRRKALEKRAAASAKATAPHAFQPYPPQPSLRPPQPQPLPQQQVTRPPSNTVSVINSRPPNANPAGQPRMATQPLQPTRPAQQPALPFNGKILAGTCVLMSRDRFLVEIGYHTQLIAIFKSVSGAQYDTQAKKWNFPISEHGNLIAAVQCLKPAVCIGGIPTNVLKILNKPTSISKEIPENDLSRIDPVLRGMLMPFQKDGVNFGINRKGRVLIADDMGLGKTIQALGIAHYYYSEWPLLIATPSSVRYAWQDSIWKWLPSVPAAATVVLESSRDDFSFAQIVITSYDLLQKRSEAFLAYKVVIMDESHHLKNSKAARTRAALPIIEKAKRAILLSGTPALSRPIELYPQVSSIVGKFGIFQYHDFGQRYCNGKKNAWGWDFSGSSNMLELQIVLEETMMIRRLKSDVLKQLPAKIRKLVVLDPNLIKLTSAGLRKTASAFIEGKHLKPMEARGKLLEYYNETAVTKQKAVSVYITDLVEAGKKFICFAHHRTLLDGISATLDELQCPYIRIDGSTAPEDRQHSVQQFQTCDDIRVAVLSITAANAGITLTAAGLVVFTELYWNPGILTQAEDRAHRIGQQDSVIVEYLLAKGTADDVLWPMVKEKLAVLNQAGLSKDNFCEADTSDFMGPSKQMDISQFFSPASQTPTLATATSPGISTTDEITALENDEDLLLQLLDESFGDGSSK